MAALPMRTARGFMCRPQGRGIAHRTPGSPDGRSTLDLFGRGFVLLRLGATPPDTSAFSAAASACGMPLTVVDISSPAIAGLYERALVLVRPDGHCAWRGDAMPENPQQIIDTVRGVAPAGHKAG